MIGLQQLKDQFETHPTNMWIFVAALVMFCLSHAIMKKIEGTDWATNSQIIDRFRALSAALLLVSLLSIHLPHQALVVIFRPIGSSGFYSYMQMYVEKDYLLFK